MIDIMHIGFVIVGFLLLMPILYLKLCLKKRLKETGKTIKLDGRCKALISILIREIQSCHDMNDVAHVLNGWVVANDLHPESVQEFNIKRVKDRLY
jgi:hypothetical protein